MTFILKLVDINLDVTKEFEKQFLSLLNTEVHHNFFEEIEEYDCMVSPANSFGMMDGGIDLAIIRYFGKELENRIQKQIITYYGGEQPVGTSFIMETNHPTHPFLVHAPTMRIPQDINGTLNVYYAMKSLLFTIKIHNETRDQKIKSVLCPGLGTYIGKMPPEKAVKQMVLAYQHFLEPVKNIHVPYIIQRTEELKNVLEM